MKRRWYILASSAACIGAALLFHPVRTAVASGIQVLAVVAAGGTGRVTLAAHNLLVGNGTSPVALIAPGTNGDCLKSAGAAADPAYSSCGGGSGGTAGSPLFVQTSSVTVTSNTESTLIGAGAGSLTIPANWFANAGTVMEVCASGVMSTAAAAQGTVNFKLKFGSTVIAQTGAFTPTANLSVDAYDFCVRLTARTVGAMGTVMASNMFHTVGTTLITPMGANVTNPTPGTAITVDTTATQVLDLTVTWSANATNSITQTNFYMVGPGSAVSSVQGLTGAVTVTDVNLSTSDVITNNCSASKHGFAPKSPNDATKYLDGTCAYSVPAGAVSSVNGATGAVTCAQASAMCLITESTPSGTATVTFSSIPATYRDLQVRVRGAGAVSATSDDVVIRFNNDSGANYDYESLAYFNATFGGGAAAGATFIYAGAINGGTAPSTSASGNIIDILDYRGTTLQKFTFARAGLKQANAAANLWAFAGITGFWRNTAAITRVDVILLGGNFAAGSVVSLYGVN